MLDFTDVTIVDSSAAAVLLEFAERRAKHGTVVIVAGAPVHVRRQLMRAGLGKPLIRYTRRVDVPPLPPVVMP